MRDRAKPSALGSAGRPGRLPRLAIALLGLLVGALTFSNVPAIAGTGTAYQQSFSFNGADTPGGGFNSDNIAIDQASGHVYVLDSSQLTPGGQGVVNVFDEDGNYLFRLDGSNTPEGTWGHPNAGPWLRNDHAGIAVDNSDGPSQGTVYVSVAKKINNFLVTGAYVDAFDPTGKFLFQIDDSSFPASDATKYKPRGIAGLAVSATGLLHAVQESGNGFQVISINKFSPEGAFITRIPIHEVFDSTSGASPHSVAIAPSGDIYTAGSTTYGTTFEGLNLFDSAGVLKATISPSGPQGVDLDPSNGAIFSTEDGFSAKYDSAARPLAKFGSGGAGIAFAHSTGHVYVAEGTSVGVFEPTAVTVPDATLSEATDVEPFSVFLNGTVNPQSVPTAWHFEYREQGKSQWLSTSEQSVAAGNSDIQVSAEVVGLQQHTIYDVRLVVENTDARAFASASGSVLTAAVAPRAETSFAAPRTDTTARLNARIDPEHAPTTFFFQYGIDTNYGSSVPLSEDAEAGDSLGVRMVSTELSGLLPSTTYHYRVVAKNEADTVMGEDETFTTRSTEEIQLPLRGLELVNSPSKGNQNIESVQVAPNLDRVRWSTSSGAGSSAGAEASFLADRTPSSWSSQSLMPPIDQLVGGGSYIYFLWWPSEDWTAFNVLAKQGILINNSAFLLRLDDHGNQVVLNEFSPAQFEQLGQPQVTADGSRAFVLTQKAPGQHLVYEFGRAKPTIVSLLPSGSIPTCGIRFSYSGGGFGAAGGSESTYRWITPDGSRLFFETAGNNCANPPNLYMRDVDVGKTTLISGPPLSGGDRGAYFIRTTTDGSEALYVTASILDSDDANDNADIYHWTASDGNDCVTCAVSGDADVQFSSEEKGREILASSDLQKIYFTSPKKLVDGLGPVADGARNVYIQDSDDLRYVTSFNSDSGNGPLGREARLSDDGETLLFRSSTPGVTTDKAGDSTQIYIYDNRARSVECVTCRRDGKPSTANFPADGPYLTGDGQTAVFGTRESLLRSDVNQDEDLYEWHNGRIGLVTDGVTKGLIPELRGISEGARDIYFTAAGRLTPEVADIFTNLYDARAGGGFPPPAQPAAPCSEDACQGPLQSAPGLASPGSASLAGPANSRAKHKKPRRKATHRHKKRRRGAHRDNARGKHNPRGKS